MSIKNLEYLKNLEITEDTELAYAMTHILNMPDIIDIEDFNFINERDMKNLKKYRDHFNFLIPRCYAIQYKYKLAILNKGNDYVLRKYIEDNKINHDDIMFFLFMKGHTINKIIDIIDKDLLSLSKDMHITFMLNDVEYVNNLSTNMIEFLLDNFDYMCRQTHYGWGELEDKFKNPLQHLPHFNEYNRSVQRIIKKRIMEYKFDDNENNKNSYENSIKFHNMFANCASVNNTMNNSNLFKNLSITDKEDEK